MMQSGVMELIHTQKFASWGLPEGSTIFITNNPSNGEYFTESFDEAESSRMLKLFVKASVNDWAIWAVGKIEDKFIDFLQKNKEIIEGVDLDSNKNKVKKGNLRSWTLFFNAISGYTNLKKDWLTVLNLGSGSLPNEHLMMLFAFIEDKLDVLPTTEELIKSTDIDKTIKELKALCKGRQDICALITNRLCNYALVNKTTISTKEIQNYVKILESNILSKDLVLINLTELCHVKKISDIIMQSQILIDKLLN